MVQRLERLTDALIDEISLTQAIEITLKAHYPTREEYGDDVERSIEEPIDED